MVNALARCPLSSSGTEASARCESTWNDGFDRTATDKGSSFARLCLMRLTLLEQFTAVRSKEVRVKGADRYRNPDQDLPADFEQERALYYSDLKLPLTSKTFFEGVKFWKASSRRCATPLFIQCGTAEQRARALPRNSKSGVRHHDLWALRLSIVAAPTGVEGWEAIPSFSGLSTALHHHGLFALAKPFRRDVALVGQVPAGSRLMS